MRLYQTIEIDRSQMISAEHSLQHAIAATHQSNLVKSIANMANPYLLGVNRRLAALLTHEYPDPDGGVLLSNAIADAANAYSHLSENDGRLDDCEEVYLTMMIRRAAEMARYSVHGVFGKKPARWVPFETDLIDWVQKETDHRKVTFALRPVSREEHISTVVFIAARILTFDRAELIAKIVQESIEDLEHVA